MRCGARACGRRHVTSSLAQSLNHTVRSLCGRDLRDIMPAPFGILHTMTIQHAAAGTPAAAVHALDSMRGMTTLIGTKRRTQRPCKLSAWPIEEGGEPLHVMRLQHSSLEQGLDERRLRLKVRLAAGGCGL